MNINDLPEDVKKKIRDADKLLDLMIKEICLQYYQDLLTFLIWTNRIGQAKRQIRQLFYDFNSDSRRPKFEQKIKDVLMKNQSNLSLGELI